jgi:cytochrome b pre-mRNA-processing protein 3
MLSTYKSHHNPLYNNLVQLSRNIFFYKKILLKDTFETRIHLIFFHLTIIMIILKNKKKIFPQNIFDNIFQNTEHNLRELGFGDVKVNKQMKNLTRIFYDILLKLNISENKNFLLNKKLITTYFDLSDNNNHLVNDLTNYFDKFYYFCFELNEDNMIKGKINF